MSKINTIRVRTGFFLTFPSVLFVFSFIIYPLINNVFLSFHDYNPLHSQEMIFIGLKNYQSLAVEPIFKWSLLITALFAVVSVTLETFAGLFVSILFTMFIKQKSQGVLKWLHRVATSIFIIPWAIPAISAAVTWRLLLHPMYSPINALLGKQIMWLSNPLLAFFSITIADVWKCTPYFIFFFIAAILAIPSGQFEAARIDGASAWHEIRYIVLPNLRPIIIVAFSFRLIDSFTKIFDMVYVLTGGGPGRATKVIPLLIQETGLKFFRFGLAAAMSVVVIFICIILGTVLLGRNKRGTNQ
ncbi:MAG: hypothetical protein DRH33_09790 [Candidatus Nealsonbacteria bacterium]|nr:MAG: hypothetical protein DRH33_09790 [Candidatus Nealsonbacteria bacterium]